MATLAGLKKISEKVREQRKKKPKNIEEDKTHGTIGRQ